MDIDVLVLRDSDRVTASGYLVRNGDGDWLQPAFPIAGPARPMQLQVRTVWRGAVRVTGADFDAVQDRFEQDGAVEGLATVTGVWSGEQLQVERQNRPKPWPWPVAVPRWATPPCPPPPGGWPIVVQRGDVRLEYDLGDLRDTGAAVAVTIFRPGRNQVVLVVAAADLAAVEARLRPQLGDRLCIVLSRWTKAQLDEVRSYLHEHSQQWNLLRWGPQNTEDGQVYIAARLTRMLPEIAAWAVPLPSGILTLEPWLTPLRARQTTTSRQTHWPR
jgi:hypothetical protein